MNHPLPVGVTLLLRACLGCTDRGDFFQLCLHLIADRNRILSGLKLGKLAPGYKAAAKVLDRLIALLLEHY